MDLCQQITLRWDLGVKESDHIPSSFASEAFNQINPITAYVAKECNVSGFTPERIRYYYRWMKFYSPVPGASVRRMSPWKIITDKLKDIGHMINY